jgi:hypothetical protein
MTGFLFAIHSNHANASKTVAGRKKDLKTEMNPHAAEL